MEKKSSKGQFIILALMFLVGFLGFVLPIIFELSAYQADEDEYREIALEIRPPVVTPIPPPPVRTAAPLSTENPITPDPIIKSRATIPTAEPDEGHTEKSIPDPEPTEQKKQPELSATQPTATKKPVRSAIPGTTTSGNQPDIQPSPAMETPTPEPQPTIDFAACLAENKDFVAWIIIPGTKIDYPVVRSDNTAYYLKHMFSGKESKLGSLFSLKSSDYKKPSKNIAIYGHHLSNSDAMFSTLLNYKKKSYYSAHSTIRLDTLYGSRTYKIFAVVDTMHHNQLAVHLFGSSGQELIAQIFAYGDEYYFTHMDEIMTIASRSSPAIQSSRGC